MSCTALAEVILVVFVRKTSVAFSLLVYCLGLLSDALLWPDNNKILEYDEDMLDTVC